VSNDIYKILLELKEGQGEQNALSKEIYAQVTKLESRVTALEHLKLTILGGAAALGGVLGLFWEKAKQLAGHLLS